MKKIIAVIALLIFLAACAKAPEIVDSEVAPGPADSDEAEVIPSISSLSDCDALQDDAKAVCRDDFSVRKAVDTGDTSWCDTAADPQACSEYAVAVKAFASGDKTVCEDSVECQERFDFMNSIEDVGSLDCSSFTAEKVRRDCLFAKLTPKTVDDCLDMEFEQDCIGVLALINAVNKKDASICYQISDSLQRTRCVSSVASVYSPSS